MLHPEITHAIAREQQAEWLIKAEQQRIAEACPAQDTLVRQMAGPLGSALIWLGAHLLRYGRTEQPPITRRYRASARSIRMN